MRFLELFEEGPGSRAAVGNVDLVNISILAEIRKKGGISRQRGATFLELIGIYDLARERSKSS